MLVAALAGMDRDVHDLQLVCRRPHLCLCHRISWTGSRPFSEERLSQEAGTFDRPVVETKGMFSHLLAKVYSTQYDALWLSCGLLHKTLDIIIDLIKYCCIT